MISELPNSKLGHRSTGSCLTLFLTEAADEKPKEVRVKPDEMNGAIGGMGWNCWDSFRGKISAALFY